jgi:hypothetical protein
LLSSKTTTETILVYKLNTLVLTAVRLNHNPSTQQRGKQTSLLFFAMAVKSKSCKDGSNHLHEKATNPSKADLTGKCGHPMVSVTYLGLRLTSTLNYTSHIKRTTQQATGILVQIFPLLAKESTLSVETKLRLYKATIRATLTYAAPTWCSISLSTYRHLKVVQNKCLRVIANAPRGTPIITLLSTLGIPPLQTYIRRIAADFYSKCYMHSNPLVRSIGHYTLGDLHKQYKKYKHKRPKHCLL